MEPVPALSLGSDMNLVFEAFRQDSARSVVPVVDDDGIPVGLLHEQDLKEFIYSPFGKDLIANRGTRYKLRHFMKHCLSFDVNTPGERILAGYAARANDPAVLITEEGRYIGVLQASALLRLMNDRQVVQARNENPLTRLPGNLSINDYFFHAFEDETADWAFVYFDFDNFKPFNDIFGFRQGDRAILMFADLLRKHFPEQEAFPAHIGGDDFFMGFHRPDKTGFIARIQDLVGTFARSAVSFYDIETQRMGCLEGLDRNGDMKCFPLLCASCAIVLLPAGPRSATPDSIGVKLAELKRQGKQSPTKSVVWTAG
jgi:diguanylate cyclase (GGDEF)-like protein